MSVRSSGAEQHQQQYRAALLDKLLRDAGFEPAMADRIQPRRRAAAPLSHAQQRLWLVHNIEGSSTAYHVPLHLRLRGRLDVDALIVALSEILERHEVLRSRIVEGEDVEQASQEPGAVPEELLAFTDLEHLRLSDREAEARRLAAEEEARPFDLSSGPLLRARLLRMSEDDHVLVLVIHHIAADAVSNGILVEELAARYAALSRGESAELEPLEVQYADFAQWQRERLSDGRLVDDLAYWREQVEGAGELQLPLDYPRPTEQSFEGAAFSAFIPGELAECLRAVAAENGCTLFMVLLGAFQVLLRKYGGPEEFLIGWPSGGRERSELQRLIGLFVNTLVMRADLRGDPTFIEFVTQRVGRTVTEAMAHQEMPFDVLVSELGIQRDPGRHPLFQVGFSLQPPMGLPLNVADLQIELFEAGNVHAARFDLEAHALESANGSLNIHFVYCSKLFDAETIRRLLDSYVMLLRQVGERPNTPLSKLSVMNEAQRRQVLVEFNETDRPYPREMTVHERFEQQVMRAPDAIAVIGEDQQLTYAQLNAAANQLAHCLRGWGVGRNVPVGLCLERTPRLIVSILAILKAGGAYLPLDPEYPESRLKLMVEAASAPIVITQDSLAGQIPATGAKVFCIDSKWDAKVANQPAENLSNINRADDLIYIIFTSGSTGTPKGVQIPHRGVARLLINTDYVDLKADETFLQMSSVSFDASTFEVWGALLHGGRLALYPERVPTLATLSEALRKHRVTTIFVTTALFNAIVDESPEILRGLHQLLFGGETASPGHVHKALAALPNTRILHVYGPTESTTFACWDLVERDLCKNARSIPLGRAIANTQVYVLDENRQSVPIGVPGELYIGGDGLALGYLGDAELTAAKFVASPFDESQRLYKTGDLMKWLPDGRLDFLGRIDQQIKIRGFRVELGEIEAALSSHPGVQRCVVLCREDTPGHKRLVAYVVSHRASPPNRKELASYLKERLPAYMTPSEFVLLEKLPLGSTGKIDRPALPAPPASEVEHAQDDEPRDERERRLAAVWAQCLAVPQVGRDENFFALGGDSITAVQLVSRAAKNGLKINTLQVFKHQTVAELAAVAEDILAQACRDDEALPATAPLTPIQHWFFEQQLVEADHFNQSVMLLLRRPTDAKAVSESLTRLLGHHDALRLRFSMVDGAWTQRFASADEPPSLRHFDFRDVSSDEASRRLRDAAAESQAALNLEHGPVFHAALIEMPHGQPQRLLLVAHHLVVDGVSWRIILEDLAMLLGSPSADFPTKTISYARWAQRASDAAKESRPGWERWLENGYESAALAVSIGEGQNTYGLARKIVSSLSRDDSQALLQTATKPYRSRVDELLMTALGRAFSGWIGAARMVVDIEGHGRDVLGEDGIDNSRTIGWFTCISPLRLDLPSSGAAISNAIKQVKEQMHQARTAAPGFGAMRYLHPSSDVRKRLGELPKAQIGFNYLGQFDSSFSDDSPLALAPDPTGPTQGPRNRRAHLIDFDARVMGGELSIDCTYCPAAFDEQTIRNLTERMLAELKQIIDYCRRDDAGGATPSDFPLVRIEQKAIDRLWGDLGPIDDVLPLSPLQEGMLYHHLSESAAGLYGVQFSVDMSAHVDEPSLKEAWWHVIARHGILRTVFIPGSGSADPMQVILRDENFDWRLEDWRTLDATDQERRFEALRADDRRTGFDLHRRSPLRWRLIRLADDRWRMLWSFHHILLDGWSMSVVLNEVMRSYEALIHARRPDLPPAPRFGGFLEWLSKHDPADAETFWKSSLQGFETSTSLPIAHAPTGASRTRELTHGLSTDLSRRLRDFAAMHNVTLNALSQAAWALLLSRYAAERVVTFGETVSGRSPEVERVDSMVGLFINTLPARVEVDPNCPLAEWLGRIQTQQVQRRQFEHTPLVKVRDWCGSRGGGDLFETLFVFENYPVDDALRAQRCALPLSNVRFDEQIEVPLAFTVIPTETILTRAVFDASRFDEADIRRLLEHFESLLTNMLADEARTIGGLSLITTAQRRELIDEINRTARPYPARPVHELFSEQTKRTPSKMAVRDDRESLTYEQLDKKSNQLATYLMAGGLKPGSTIGLCVERGANLTVGILGILKTGAAYVPLDSAQPAARSREILTDAGASVLVTESAFSATFGEDLHVVQLDNDAERIALESETAPAVHMGPDDLAYVMYTSGSTGRPKGVCVPHRAIARLVLNTDYVQIESGDHIAQASNAAFDAATFEIWGALLNGATLEIISRHDALSADAISVAIQQRQITTMFLTTALFNQLSRRPGVFAPLRYVLFGGEQVDVDAVRRVLKSGPRHLLHVYGPTENTTFSTWYEITSVPEDARTIPIGRGIANSTCHVLDPAGQPCPVGVPGELFVGGDGVARGYLNRPELTAERFVPDPFAAAPGATMYRTGDIVRWNAERQIEFIGRRDHQIKLRGFRVELGEIENAIVTTGHVREAIVVCRESEGEKELIAYVAPKVEVEALRRSLQERLPRYMVPATIVALEALPLNANGKVDRKSLPQPHAPSGVAEIPKSGSALEEQVRSIWKQVLGHDAFGLDDNFFDVGGHSLRLVRVHAAIKEQLQLDCPLTALFEHSTIRSLSRCLSGDHARNDSLELARSRIQPADKQANTTAVAIVALAGRFPGALSVETFWNNLKGGVESIRFFTRDELLESGIDSNFLDNPHYVRARAVLDDVDQFDAAFFGYNPREAELIDPQQRLFLECAHEALERAGTDPKQYPGRIGVFGGCNLNTYLYNLRSRPDIIASAGDLQLLTSSDKDFLVTRVAYKLDLRGPAVSVQTACSTSLVAVHQACRSLLAGDCDMALAGGVSITFPTKRGYLYTEQGIASPDGHCRTFDADARGTIGGDGVAIVVLKRLEDALRDGDTIRAVIRGSAINNDGAEKVGFTAPSIEGQAGAVAAALAAARIEPDTIDYVEAHGTATELGDPIELAALRRAFGERPPSKDRCLIGSVKSNVGHLDAAAGATGLIKAALAISHGQIPPTLHFKKPNPKLGIENSPFAVADRLQPWRETDGRPRRAGVSSFGMGGTNAHVVIEQAPPQAASPAGRREQVLLLSARTPGVLDAASARLAAHLRDHPDINLADVAHTLRVGRRRFEHRRAVVCHDVAGAMEALEKGGERSFTGKAIGQNNGVVFLFPGQGTQYAGMARGLYESEPIFREVMDRYAELFKSHDLDLKAVLVGGAEASLWQTSMTQAAIFAVEVAMARLWMSRGVCPSACIGHSIGEIAAAVVCEALSLEDGVTLVAARGKLMDAAPAGTMLAVPMSAEELRPYLGTDLWLSAVNAPRLCTVSGETAAIEQLQSTLQARGVESRRLKTSGAFHSGLMDAVIEPLIKVSRTIHAKSPSIPYVSNLTGGWITASDLSEPRYWARHVRETVRFADGMATILKQQPSAMLEAGPGHSLSQLARAQFDAQQRQSIVTVQTIRHATESAQDADVLVAAIAQLAVRGIEIDWNTYEPSVGRRHIELPTYPFERQRYWIDPGAGEPARVNPSDDAKRRPLDEWFYAPAWRQADVVASLEELRRSPRRWLLLGEKSAFVAALAARLRQLGQTVLLASPATEFAFLDDGDITLSPLTAAHYDALWARLAAESRLPDVVINLWNLASGQAGAEDSGEAAHAILWRELYLAQAIGRRGGEAAVQMLVVSGGLQAVLGDEASNPRRAAAIGAAAVLSLEMPHVRCRSLDLPPQEVATAAPDLVDRVAIEALIDSRDREMAIRGRHRWVRRFERMTFPAIEGCPRRLREGGAYLITGGLGGIGLALAVELARRCRAKVALLGRRHLPPREQWQQMVGRSDDRIAGTIRQIIAIEEAGGEVMVLPADVTNEGQMRQALAEVRARFGPVHGVIHSAGTAPGGIIQLKDPAAAAAVLDVKVRGAEVLEEILRGDPLDFIAHCSSLASVIGVPGQVDYGAANAVLDAMAHARAASGVRPPVLTINWDTWSEVGMAVVERQPQAEKPTEVDLRRGIRTFEGAEAFVRMIDAPCPQVLVSITDLAPRMESWLGGMAVSAVMSAAAGTSRGSHQRPDLGQAYVAPRNDLERSLADIWSELLGIKEVGANDDFFELGGHSLMATQLLSRLRDTFLVDLTLQQVFASPTVAGVASLAVKQERKPGQTDKIATLVQKVKTMSPDERQQLLAKRPAQKDAL